MADEYDQKPIVVGSYNFSFVARDKARAAELTIAEGGNGTPSEVVDYILRCLENLQLVETDTLVEVHAEGHMPQMTGNSQQLGNAIISVRGITVR